MIMYDPTDLRAYARILFRLSLVAAMLGVMLSNQKVLIW